MLGLDLLQRVLDAYMLAVCTSATLSLVERWHFWASLFRLFLMPAVVIVASEPLKAAAVVGCQCISMLLRIIINLLPIAARLRWSPPDVAARTKAVERQKQRQLLLQQQSQIQRQKEQSQHLHTREDVGCNASVQSPGATRSAAADAYTPSPTSWTPSAAPAAVTAPTASRSSSQAAAAALVGARTDQPTARAATASLAEVTMPTHGTAAATGDTAATTGGGATLSVGALPAAGVRVAETRTAATQLQREVAAAAAGRSPESSTVVLLKAVTDLQQLDQGLKEDEHLVDEHLQKQNAGEQMELEDTNCRAFFADVDSFSCLYQQLFPLMKTVRTLLPPSPLRLTVPIGLWGALSAAAVAYLRSAAQPATHCRARTSYTAGPAATTVQADKQFACFALRRCTHSFAKKAATGESVNSSVLNAEGVKICVILREAPAVKDAEGKVISSASREVGHMEALITEVTKETDTAGLWRPSRAVDDIRKRTCPRTTGEFKDTLVSSALGEAKHSSACVTKAKDAHSYPVFADYSIAGSCNRLALNYNAHHTTYDCKSISEVEKLCKRQQRNSSCTRRTCSIELLMARNRDDAVIERDTWNETASVITAVADLVNASQIKCLRTARMPRMIRGNGLNFLTHLRQRIYRCVKNSPARVNSAAALVADVYFDERYIHLLPPKNPHRSVGSWRTAKSRSVSDASLLGCCDSDRGRSVVTVRCLGFDATHEAGCIDFTHGALGGFCTANLVEGDPYKYANAEARVRKSRTDAGEVESEEFVRRVEATTAEELAFPLLSVDKCVPEWLGELAVGSFVAVGLLLTVWKPFMKNVTMLRRGRARVPPIQETISSQLK